MEYDIADGICFGKEKSGHQKHNFSALMDTDSPIEELSPLLEGEVNNHIGPYETHYKVDYPCRGTAIIFNHEHFIANDSRTGTHYDCSRISKVLEHIGFKVKVYTDYTYKKIMKTIEKAAKKDHSKNDCIVVIIMSHGDLGTISACDISYKPEDLYERFIDDNCPSLKDKPKLFFIQACRGTKVDGGVIIRTETDGAKKKNPEFQIFTHPDFIIAYSTVPGYFSWRNVSNGSWFIQELCNQLENIYEMDMLKLLTHVSRYVVFDYESNVPDDPIKHRQKQIPCITSTLTRILQFNRKNL